MFASTHPWIKQLLENMSVEQAAVPVADGAQTVAKAHPYAALNAFVKVQMSGTPYKRPVQIFELQRRAPLGNAWSNIVYSSTMFLYSDLDRAAGREPESAPSLAAISPPDGWKFEHDGWVVDRHPESFLKNRSPELHIQVVTSESNDEGWIYDKLNKEGMVDMVYEFRRRRLVNVCERV